MHRAFRRIAIIIAVVLGIFLADSQTFTKAYADSFESCVMREVNGYREKNGLSTLAYSSKMEIGADVRAKEISRFWSHTRPDGSDYYTADENLIYGENIYEGEIVVSNAKDVVACWIDSAPHRANILASDFKSASVGVYEIDGERYVSLEFGY